MESALNMSETRVMKFSEPELRDPVAVVGFPTVGLVGSILSGLLVKELDLPVVAGITSPDMPPYTFVSDGLPCPQIRIMAGQPRRVRRKKKAETKEEDAPAKKTRSKPHDVVVVTSEIAPKPEQTYDISRTILDTLRSLGVNDIICLEGVAGYEASAPLGGVGGNEDTRKKLEDAGLTLMKDGIVRGVSGILLMEGSYEGMNVMSLMVPANAQLPDPRAAARLMDPITAMYPRIAIDTEPLFREAEEIDSRVQAQQALEGDPSTGGIYR